MRQFLAAATACVAAALSLSSCATSLSPGCQPRITSAEVASNGAVVRLEAKPSECAIDFTDGRQLTLRLGPGSDPTSRTSSFNTTVRAEPDGAFKTEVAVPPDLPAGPAYATVSGGYNANTTGDVSLNVVRFTLPE